jgi:hypothetical protein
MFMKQLLLFVAAAMVTSTNNAVLESIVLILEKANRALDKIATTIETSCLKMEE